MTTPTFTQRCFDSKFGRPLNLFPDGTLAISSRLCRKILDGYGFVGGGRLTVTAGTSLDIFFGNPANSGRTIKIVAVHLRSDIDLDVDIYKNNTRTAGGTSLTISNLNFSSNIQSVAILEKGGTYTLGEPMPGDAITAGSGVFAIGGHVEVGGVALMPEDTNLLLHIINTSTSDANLVVRILWLEEVIS